MTLTRYGKWEWGGGGVAALLLTAGFILPALGCCPVTGGILAGFTVLAYFCLAMFFRNPVRNLPDDPALLGAPEGFTVNVSNVKVCAGAGFIVAYTGDIMTMPGLPKVPAAERIDVDENGVISGLF